MKLVCSADNHEQLRFTLDKASDANLELTVVGKRPRDPATHDTNKRWSEVVVGVEPGPHTYVSGLGREQEPRQSSCLIPSCASSPLAERAQPAYTRGRPVGFRRVRSAATSCSAFGTSGSVAGSKDRRA